MKSRALALLLAVAAVLVGAWLLLRPSSAVAHMGEEKFRIERRTIRPPDGPRGIAEIRTRAPGEPARLARNADGAYVGTFTVANTGPGPLTVSRVYLAGTDDDPRGTPGLSAVPEGNARTPIPPGGSRVYDVTWRSEQARVLELYATFVVESDGAQPDADAVDPPKLVGVVATRRLGLAKFAPTVLVLAPLALILAALVGRFAGRRAGKLAATVVALAVTVFAIWTFTAVNPELARRDGNDGLQFIHRFVLDRKSGVEWFLGIDGWSHALLLVVAGVVLSAVALADTGRADWARVTAALGGLGAGATLAIVGQTTLLFVIGVAIAGTSATMMLWDGKNRSASIQAGVATLVAVALLGWATVEIARLSGGTFLLDGSPVDKTYALSDVARARLVQHLEPLLGLPAYRAVWLLTFAGCAPLLPFAPLHGWIGAASTASSRGASAAIAILPALGGYGLLRLGIAMQPDGARWAAESLPSIGLAVIVAGAAFALAERDLRRIAGALALGRAGALLLFAFSLTPGGVDGALGVVVSQPVAMGLFVLGAQAAHDRVRDANVEQVRGLRESAPLLAVVVSTGALALGAMLLPGVSASLVGVVGSFGRNPVTTIFGALALALLVAAGARAARAAFGTQPKAWETSKYLEPFGGAPPDLRARELSAAAPLLILALLLALAPRPFLAPADRVIRDLWPALDSPGPTQVF